MNEWLPEIDQWRGRGDGVALAAAGKGGGAAPRPVGARMAVSTSGGMAGSGSGGCVEPDVFTAAQEVLGSGEPRLLRYGITDEMAWDVGLACGGTIEVFVEPVAEDASPGGIGA